MQKNLDGWKITSLEYDPETDETCIVCGENRQYKIPKKWTADTMIYALKNLRMKGRKDAGRKRFCRGKEPHSRRSSIGCLKTERSGKENRRLYVGNVLTNTRNGTIVEWIFYANEGR